MGERLTRRKTPISKTLVSFALFINLLVLFLLFKDVPFVNTFFAYLSGFAGSLFLVALLISFLRNRKKPVKVKLTEKKLVLHYLRTTRKYILVSIVGMILAVLILSQGFLIPHYYEDRIVVSYFGDADYVESFNIYVFPEYVEEPGSGGKIGNLNLTEKLVLYDALYDASISALKNTLLPVTFGFDQIPLFSTLNHTAIYGEVVDDYFYLGISIYPLTERNQEYLERAYGTHSSFNNDTVISVVSEDADIVLRSLETYPLLKRNEFGEEQYLLNTTKIQHVTDSRIASDSYTYREPVRLFVSMEIFNDLIKWMDVRDYGGIDQITLFSSVPPAENIREQANQMKSIGNKLTKALNKIAGNSFAYNSPYENLLNEVLNLLEGIRIVILLLVAPIIGLGLYLMYFASTLVERRRKRLLTIMKLRGTTEDELKILFLTEITTSSIMATIVGMVLSVPWTFSTLNFTGTLGEVGNRIPLPSDWFYVIPLIGFALTFDVNIVPMFRMAGRDLLDELTPEEQKKPRWQRYNLDLILLAIGIIDYSLFKWFPIKGPLDGVIVIIFLLSPFAIIGIFLGFSLFVSRIFAPAIGRFSDFMWVKRGNLFALATRNMRQTRFTSSKFVAFTLFGLMVGYTLILLPTNIAEYNSLTAYYNEGADIRISSPLPFNSSLIANVSSIPGVEATTMTMVGSLDVNTYFRVMGVNHSTFAAAAFWKPEFSSEGLTSLMSQLGENESNVLLHPKTADNYGVKQGDPLFLLGLQSYHLTVAGTFDYFPNLMGSSPFFGADYMIMNLDYALNANITDISYYLYVKLKQNVNVTSTLELIRSAVPGFTVSSPLEKTFNDIVFESVTGSILQSSLWLTIVIISVSSLFYTFITLADRKKEIAIFRAIGMKERQIFSLLVVETLTIMGVGIVLGTVAGYILNEFIVGLIFLGDFLVLPFDFVIPWTTMALFNAFVIAIAIFSAAFPARRIARVQTGSILRAE